MTSEFDGRKGRLLISSLPGIAIAIVFYILIPGDEFPLAPYMAAIMALMATWWIQEVIPIPVTSLLPLFLFPLFEISDTTEVSANYGSPIIFLFLGGFLLAFGLQASGVHKRIALKVISVIGSNPRQLILGFMVVSAGLSMWISNTATVMVMLPIGLSIIENPEIESNVKSFIGNFRICFVLGLSYASSIGGMATLIGTPPNLIYLEMQADFFPGQPTTGFLEWLIYCLPICFVFLIIGWYVITRYVYYIPRVQGDDGSESIQSQLKTLGPIRKDEVRTVLVFALAAILWITGSDIKFSNDFIISGWRSIFGIEEVSDAAVAVFAACALFIIPSGERTSEALLTWKATKELPWGVLLLFGGGFAMAEGFETSGLSKMVEVLFRGVSGLPPILLLSIVCMIVLVQTEFTSNSAVVTLVLPILASASIAYNIRPEFLMIPATLAASCAFMLPVATPPNAIVYSMGYVSIKQMMKAGLWFNIIGFILITGTFSLLHIFFWS